MKWKCCSFSMLSHNKKKFSRQILIVFLFFKESFLGFDHRSECQFASIYLWVLLGMISRCSIDRQFSWFMSAERDRQQFWTLKEEIHITMLNNLTLRNSLTLTFISKWTFRRAEMEEKHIAPLQYNWKSKNYENLRNEKLRSCCLSLASSSDIILVTYN